MKILPRLWVFGAFSAPGPCQSTGISGCELGERIINKGQIRSNELVQSPVDEAIRLTVQARTRIPLTIPMYIISPESHHNCQNVRPVISHERGRMLFDTTRKNATSPETHLRRSRFRAPRATRTGRRHSIATLSAASRTPTHVVYLPRPFL